MISRGDRADRTFRCPPGLLMRVRQLLCLRARTLAGLNQHMPSLRKADNSRIRLCEARF